MSGFFLGVLFTLGVWVFVRAVIRARQEVDEECEQLERQRLECERANRQSLERDNAKGGRP
jgi:hypothetical protein